MQADTWPIAINADSVSLKWDAMNNDNRTLHQLAQGFWNEFLRRRPAFPVSDGMFPFEPATRDRYIEGQGRTYAVWRVRAIKAGFSTEDFFRACIRVRAAMY
ncbi:hypothetical protein [Cupriavidus necator]